MRFSFPLLTVFFLLYSVGLYAQRTVQGTVTSMSKGEPLVGAMGINNFTFDKTIFTAYHWLEVICTNYVTFNYC